MTPLPPPPGYISWLEYAIATMDTRTLHLQSFEDESDEGRLWGGTVSRDAMTNTANAELVQLRQALSGLTQYSHELVFNNGDETFYCSYCDGKSSYNYKKFKHTNDCQAGASWALARKVLGK